MFRSSLDAIRRLLKETIPEVAITYVNTAPDGFEQPSFFVQLAAHSSEFLNLNYRQQRMTWQIVYFPRLARGGEPDAFDQLDVSDRLMGALQASPALSAPDGSCYSLAGIDGGPRDGEVYITVILEGQAARELPEYDKMQEVHLDQNGG
ncbi:hypothetical protein HGI30_15240 [Paenibacillus albicereus]|uniref:Uncharacterized protein n=1 Tax=Paenibacillus albicereus TaxID=2726185 RepID=A0A6H2GZG4_9BACL|nr:hypothetical protein [Paenibacillus albicereus]QJC52787.1 hypothetical protein HGI30_15240 [Paenibacillus albicereus]